MCPPPHSGFQFGRLVAYRIWRIDRNRLISLSAGYVWKPGANGPAQGMGVDGGGFYAFKELSGAVELSGGPRSTGRGRRYPCAIGKVSLWGEIVEHELGYRAQFAKIIELIPRGQPCTRTVMKTARDRMGEALWARYMAAWEKERATSLAAWNEQMAALRRYYRLD
jgi:hypothetical protein